MTSNPIFVENIRGDTVENLHRGAAIVMNYRGETIASWGDVDRPVFARSSIKYLQSIPLIESGAAEAYALSNVEVALSCSSHGGERAHVDHISQWLARMGLNQNALRCGASRPSHGSTYKEMIHADQEWTPLHNACSGKHTGFLTLCLHKGYPLEGYTTPDHPVQRLILETLEEVMQVDGATLPCGIDGCSIPAYAYPLRNIALGMTRLSPKGLGLSKIRKQAIDRIRDAVAKNPFYVAGSNRLDTLVMEITAGDILLKMGADGIYAACIPEKGVGIALKIDDGTPKAAEVAMGVLLSHFYTFSHASLARLQPYFSPTISNYRKMDTGRYRTHQGWLSLA